LRCASARLVDDVAGLASKKTVEDLLDGPTFVFGQLRTLTQVDSKWLFPRVSENRTGLLRLLLRALSLLDG
jgi:hypothetical protein